MNKTIEEYSSEGIRIENNMQAIPDAKTPKKIIGLLKWRILSATNPPIDVPKIPVRTIKEEIDPA